MKSKAGFTLIELLAVIVILAIVATIATPIVLNIIGDVRKSTFKKSVETILDSVILDGFSLWYNRPDGIFCPTYLCDNGKCENIYSKAGENGLVDILPVDSKNLIGLINMCNNEFHFTNSDTTLCAYNNEHGDIIVDSCEEELDYVEPPKIEVTSNSIKSSYEYYALNKYRKFYYKIDDEDWIETSNMSYTFDGLVSNQTYIIQTKIKEIGFFSKTFKASITTNDNTLQNCAGIDNCLLSGSSSNITADKINEIIFEPSISNSENTWDVSFNRNDLIKAWVTNDENNSGKYILHIGSNNKIYANSYSRGLFSTYKEITTIDFNNHFDTSNVIDMGYMFHSCSNLQTLDLSSFDTSNVIDMDSMFRECSNLQTLDLSSFDTGNVIDMGNMFDSCSNLQTLDLSSFDTGNVTNMDGMFEQCGNLQTLDLSNFNTSSLEYASHLFSNASSLNTIKVGCNWNIDNDSIITGIFDGAGVNQVTKICPQK